MLESYKGPCGKRLRGSIGIEWRTGKNNTVDVFKPDEVATSGSASEEAGQVCLPFLPRHHSWEEEVR